MMAYRPPALSVLLLSLSVFAARGETASPEVWAAAKEGLPAFLKAIPPSEAENYGFDGAGELARATLGEPIPHFTIEPSALAGWQPGTPAGALMKPTGLWYFPVLVRKEIRAFLLVDRMDGTWRAVSLGMAPLARSWGQVTRRWAGCRPQLIEVYQASQFLFTVPEQGPHNLTAIAPGEGPRDYGALGDASLAVRDLRARVETNLREWGAP